MCHRALDLRILRRPLLVEVRAVAVIGMVPGLLMETAVGIGSLPTGHLGTFG